jgi:hypothetical protein
MGPGAGGHACSMHAVVRTRGDVGVGERGELPGYTYAGGMEVRLEGGGVRKRVAYEGVRGRAACGGVRKRAVCGGARTLAV